MKGNHKHCGLIPDVCSIIYKYKLEEYIHEFISTGHFSSKLAWKKLVNEKISSVQNEPWKTTIDSVSQFTRFRDIHKAVSFANYWRKSKTCSEIGTSFIITKLLMEIPVNNVKL